MVISEDIWFKGDESLKVTNVYEDVPYSKQVKKWFLAICSQYITETTYICTNRIKIREFWFTRTQSGTFCYNCKVSQSIVQNCLSWHEICTVQSWQWLICNLPKRICLTLFFQSELSYFLSKVYKRGIKKAGDVSTSPDILSFSLIVY